MNIVPFIAVIGGYGDLVLPCPYTVFTDCGTGHEDFEVCIIEAPMADAKVVFYNTFGHSAERVSQVEIGADYTIEEIDTASGLLDRLEHLIDVQTMCRIRVLTSREIPIDKRAGKVPL